MKKRSGASSKRRELTVFLDRNLGRGKVANRLRQDGIQVEIHDDHFASDTADYEWLAKAGANGWLVFTKDKRIRYRRNEWQAARDHGVCLFVLTARGVTGEEIGEIFAKAWPKIASLAQRQAPPFVAKVTRGSDVVLYQS